MIRRIAFLILVFSAALPAFSQGNSTDDRKMQLYAFGGATGTYTGLDGGKNLGITAGADLGFGFHYGLLPMLEVRGTIPMDSGTVVGEKNFLVGLKVEKVYGRLHPYFNILYGQGQMEYNGPGFLNPSGTVLYQRTNSSVFSPGIGVDYDLSPSIAFKADLQLQHYDTPVAPSGSVYSKAITIGAVYRFGFGQNRPY